MSDFIDTGIKSFKDRLGAERSERLLNSQNVISFGVKFLDDALAGILRNDLILLGAKTGVGKTELATCIAMNAALVRKRVHYFALESEPNEIERRIKYKLLAQTQWERFHERLNYLDWYVGKLDKELTEAEKYIDENLGPKYETLNTFYRQKDFTVDDLEKKILAVQDVTDLIILDHLHYIDSDDPNENRGYKIIVKKIRDLALSIGKPVIVVAHVRKSDRRSKQLIPGIEDFHGTSDVPKIATKTIMLAPDDTPASGGAKHLWPTFMHIAKCRHDGSRTKYLGLVTFNVREGKYENDYRLARLTNFGEAFEPLATADYPHWARNP